MLYWFTTLYDCMTATKQNTPVTSLQKYKDYGKGDGLTFIDWLLWGETYVSELLPLTYIVHPQKIYEYGEWRWNDIDGENQRTRRKTCPSATLSTTNPTRTDPGKNLGLCSERLASNNLSHGMADGLTH
jgi:hypothetical protein